jgi:KaiC/GvpD/RAD55 family RecA-like ATPase
MLNETVSAAAIVAAWSADVYVKREVKHADPLLGPLSRGCVTLLCGPRGVGKSWLALALAHTAARGGTLATWRAHRKHRVVYLDVAGSEAVLHERLIALGPDKPPPSLVIVPGDAQAGGLPDLSLESGRTALDHLITDCDLLVIDGVSALVRKGRGVGARWAALDDWLRSLRRRYMAVLLVDTKEPKALSDVADAVLKVDRPADGVQEGDLRLQAKLLSSRPDLKETQRFELRLTLRKDGAAWTYIDDLDHRAIMAYRLDRADYSSRQIAKLLDVSPTTAWRLVSRGERLPAHVRDGVDLDVPIPPREKPKRDWAAIVQALGMEALPNLLPREKGGPAPQARGDEGQAALAVSAVEDLSGGDSPSPLYGGNVLVLSADRRSIDAASVGPDPRPFHPWRCNPKGSLAPGPEALQTRTVARGHHPASARKGQGNGTSGRIDRNRCQQGPPGRLRASAQAPLQRRQR